MPSFENLIEDPEGGLHRLVNKPKKKIEHLGDNKWFGLSALQDTNPVVDEIAGVMSSPEPTVKPPVPEPEPKPKLLQVEKKPTVAELAVEQQGPYRTAWSKPELLDPNYQARKSSVDVLGPMAEHSVPKALTALRTAGAPFEMLGGALVASFFGLQSEDRATTLYDAPNFGNAARSALQDVWERGLDIASQVHRGVNPNLPEHQIARPLADRDMVGFASNLRRMYGEKIWSAMGGEPPSEERAEELDEALAMAIWIALPQDAYAIRLGMSLTRKAGTAGHLAKMLGVPAAELASEMWTLRKEFQRMQRKPGGLYEQMRWQGMRGVRGSRSGAIRLPGIPEPIDSWKHTPEELQKMAPEVPAQEIADRHRVDILNAIDRGLPVKPEIVSLYPETIELAKKLGVKFVAPIARVPEITQAPVVEEPVGRLVTDPEILEAIEESSNKPVYEKGGSGTVRGEDVSGRGTVAESLGKAAEGGRSVPAGFQEMKVTRPATEGDDVADALLHVDSLLEDMEGNRTPVLQLLQDNPDLPKTIHGWLKHKNPAVVDAVKRHLLTRLDSDELTALGISEGMLVPGAHVRTGGRRPHLPPEMEHRSPITALDNYEKSILEWIRGKASDPSGEALRNFDDDTAQVVQSLMSKGLVGAGVKVQMTKKTRALEQHRLYVRARASYADRIGKLNEKVAKAAKEGTPIDPGTIKLRQAALDAALAKQQQRFEAAVKAYREDPTGRLDPKIYFVGETLPDGRPVTWESVWQERQGGYYPTAAANKPLSVWPRQVKPTGGVGEAYGVAEHSVKLSREGTALETPIEQRMADLQKQPSPSGPTTEDDMIFPARRIVIDTETTGPVEHRGAQVIELAAVVLDRNGKVVDEFHTLIKPSQWDAQAVEAAKVHGITPKMLSEAMAPDTKEAANAFRAWYNQYASEGIPVTSYNVGFDRAMMSRMGIEVPWDKDIMELATKHMGEKGLLKPANKPGQQWLFPSLESAAQHYQVPVSAKHRAQADVRTAAEVLRAAATREKPSAKAAQAASVRPAWVPRETTPWDWPAGTEVSPRHAEEAWHRRFDKAFAEAEAQRKASMKPGENVPAEEMGIDRALARAMVHGWSPEKILRWLNEHKVTLRDAAGNVTGFKHNIPDPISRALLALIQERRDILEKVRRKAEMQKFGGQQEYIPTEPLREEHRSKWLSKRPESKLPGTGQLMTAEDIDKAAMTFTERFFQNKEDLAEVWRFLRDPAVPHYWRQKLSEALANRLKTSPITEDVLSVFRRMTDEQLKQELDNLSAAERELKVGERGVYGVTSPEYASVVQQQRAALKVALERWVGKDADLKRTMERPTTPHETSKAGAHAESSRSRGPIEGTMPDPPVQKLAEIIARDAYLAGEPREIKNITNPRTGEVERVYQPTPQDVERATAEIRTQLAKGQELLFPHGVEPEKMQVPGISPSEMGLRDPAEGLLQRQPEPAVAPVPQVDLSPEETQRVREAVEQGKPTQQAVRETVNARKDPTPQEVDEARQHAELANFGVSNIDERNRILASVTSAPNHKFAWDNLTPKEKQAVVRIAKDTKEQPVVVLDWLHSNQRMRREYAQGLLDYELLLGEFQEAVRPAIERKPWGGFWYSVWKKNLEPKIDEKWSGILGTVKARMKNASPAWLAEFGKRHPEFRNWYYRWVNMDEGKTQVLYDAMSRTTRRLNDIFQNMKPTETEVLRSTTMEELTQNIEHLAKAAPNDPIARGHVQGMRDALNRWRAKGVVDAAMTLDDSLQWIGAHVPWLHLTAEGRRVLEDVYDFLDDAAKRTVSGEYLAGSAKYDPESGRGKAKYEMLKQKIVRDLAYHTMQGQIEYTTYRENLHVMSAIAASDEAIDKNVVARDIEDRTAKAIEDAEGALDATNAGNAIADVVRKEMAARGYVQLPEDARMGTLAGWWVTQSMADNLEELAGIRNVILEAFGKSGSTADLWKGVMTQKHLHRGLRLWKMGKTAFDLSVSAWNMASNAFVLTDLAGYPVGPLHWENTKRFGQAGKRAAQFLLGKPDELTQLALRSGVQMDVSLVAAEMADSVDAFTKYGRPAENWSDVQYLSKMLKERLSPSKEDWWRALVGGSKEAQLKITRFYTAQDNWLRLYLFDAALNGEGMAPVEAARWANEHAINYSRTSRLVKLFARTPVGGEPFLRFTAASTDLAARTLINKPWRPIAFAATTTLIPLVMAALYTGKSPSDIQNEKEAVKLGQGGLYIPIPNSWAPGGTTDPDGVSLLNVSRAVPDALWDPTRIFRSRARLFTHGDPRGWMGGGPVPTILGGLFNYDSFKAQLGLTDVSISREYDPVKQAKYVWEGLVPSFPFGRGDDRVDRAKTVSRAREILVNPSSIPEEKKAALDALKEYGIGDKIPVQRDNESAKAYQSRINKYVEELIFDINREPSVEEARVRSWLGIRLEDADDPNYQIMSSRRLDMALKDIHIAKDRAFAEQNKEAWAKLDAIEKELVGAYAVFSERRKMLQSKKVQAK